MVGAARPGPGLTSVKAVGPPDSKRLRYSSTVGGLRPGALTIRLFDNPSAAVRVILDRMGTLCTVVGARSDAF